MDVVVLGNFDLFPRDIAPNFTRTGTWYEFFRGTTIEVGTSNQNTPISIPQGEYRLYTSKQVARPSFLLGVEDALTVDDEGVLFEIFPNPFSDRATVIFSDEGAVRPRTLEFFSVNGARIRTIVIPAGISEVEIEGGDLPKGVYYVRVTSGRESSARKVVRY